MNVTEVCVNISIIYFLLVINNTIIDIITARKQQLQSIHFNEEHFIFHHQKAQNHENSMAIYRDKAYTNVKSYVLSKAYVFSQIYSHVRNNPKNVAVLFTGCLLILREGLAGYSCTCRKSFL